MLQILIESALRSLVLGIALGLTSRLLRVRNPHAESMAWRLVLLASIAMPALMQWTPIAAATPALTWTSPLESAAATSSTRLDWRTPVIAIYLLGAAGLLLRQLRALAHGWRIVQCAKRIEEAFAADLDLRVSREIVAPATFASTILLPAGYRSWSSHTRRAVLAHEQMHVSSWDFYVQLLAHLHLAVFWFSPFAWWLPRKLAILSEQVSDDAAIRRVRDRAAYAQVLLDFSRGPVALPGSVAMARPPTVIDRIERILSEPVLHEPLRVTRRFALACGLMPLVLIAACGAPDTMPPKSNSLYPLSAPIYPDASRRGGQQGTVVLRLRVLESGRVGDVRIGKSSGFPSLDSAAASEARQWRLDPGTTRGRPVPMWGEFAVTFKLTH